MIRRLLPVIVLAAVSAAPSPSHAALRGPAFQVYAGANCTMVTISDSYGGFFGGPGSWIGVGLATGSSCEVRVNGLFEDTIHTAGGIVASLDPAVRYFTGSRTDTVEVCTSSGACDTVGQSAPFENGRDADPAVCAALLVLAPIVNALPGGGGSDLGERFKIDPDSGDLMLAHEDHWDDDDIVWDCPDYVD
jgi:hypothetical protein